MKKIFKILLIVIVLSSMFILPSYKVYAADNVISGGQGFVDLGKNQDKIKQSDIKSVSDQVYNILLAVATVTAVLVGAVLGIQFMTGSMEDQAKVKESLVPFVFGCIIVFGAFGIWKVASLIASSL